MSTPVLLTIKGVTMSAAEWSRKPGTAKYATILARLTRHGYEHERAVFGEVQRGGKTPHELHNRNQRMAVSLTPAPPAHVHTPPRPRFGGFRSYPIEALALLRRCA